MDKIVRTILALFGELLQMKVTITKYMLGLIWITYSYVRGKNYKKRFDTLNKSFVHNMKMSLYVIFDKESE